MVFSFKAIKERWLDLCDDHPRLNTTWEFVKRWSPPVNYITIHYAYFIIVTMLSSLVFWGSGEPLNSVSYTDSLFLVTSAMTNTGLNTVNLSSLTTWQQVILWLLCLVGSFVWVSFWTVMVRKSAFEVRFKAIVASERDMRRKVLSEKQQTALPMRRAFTSLPNLPPTEPSEQTLSRPGAASRHTAIGVGTGAAPYRAAAEASATIPLSEASTVTPASTGTSTLKETAPKEEQVVKDVYHPSTSDHVAFAEPPTALRPVGQMLPAHPNGPENGRRASAATSESSLDLEDYLFHWKKIVNQRNVSKRGQFFDLTREERERLGGTEYRALKILAVIVPVYAIGWMLFAAIGLGAWFYVWTNPDETNQMGGWWVGIYYSVSGFNNAGFSLVDDSLIPFQGDYFVLIVVAALILAGNTAYPIFLRLILWSMLQVLNWTTHDPSWGPWKETLEFTLKYPRRVYTTLFPAKATWWLVAVLLFTNFVDWIAFELMNIGNPAVTELSVGDRIMSGLFQAVSVRAAGFAVISLSSLYIGLQMLYLLMMYISVYPVSITMRNSNVYEERSLGIYEDDPNEKEIENEQPDAIAMTTSADEPSRTQFLKKSRRRKTGQIVGQAIRTSIRFDGVGAVRQTTPGEEASSLSYITQQMRGQLAHDLWWLVIAILIIVLIETDHFLTDPVTYSVFNIIFECVSAYGCVGLSVGLPTQSYSFSGALHDGSKVILCIIMLRGRHRGLPVAVDRAVRLPGDKLRQDEEKDAKIRRAKTFNMPRIAEEV